MSIGATTVGTGTGPLLSLITYWSLTFRLGSTMYWSLNFLTVVSKKAKKITASSHQNAGFSMRVFKNFPGVIPPDPHSGRGDPLQHPTPIPAFGQVRDPNLGPPQFFSRSCAPATVGNRNGGCVGVSNVKYSASHHVAKAYKE